MSTWPWTVAVAAVAGSMVGFGYLLWPRRLTASEWIAHRRGAEGLHAMPAAGTGASGFAPRMVPLLPRFIRTPDELAKDLAILRLAGSGLPADEDQLRRGLVSTAAAAAVAGLVAGFAVWFVQGFAGLPVAAGLLPVAAAVAMPLCLVRLVHQRAEAVRLSLDRALPRVMTCARMLLESGAATPESALTRAAFLFDDPCVEVVREAARLREVELIPIDQALERVAARYSVEPLHRLADAYRIAVQYGTGISGVLTDFSDYLRSRTESEERARITSAPVRMVPVALLFFLVPFMSLIGFLIYGPLVGLLGQV